MAKKQVRGTTPDQELSAKFVFRDTKTNQFKLVKSLFDHPNSFIILLSMAAVVLVVPEFREILLIVAIILAACTLFKKTKLPLKLPIQSGMKDPNEISPGSNRPEKAKGILFLGNEIGTNKELWLSDADCRQHFLVLGTTGSGKTEVLLGLAANAMSWGSGCIFCDGKGDVSLYAKIFALAKRFGRENDLLVLNFMTGNRDIGSNCNVQSNTFNPFATGSSDSLAQLIISLMDDVSGSGSMWQGRATAMFTGIIRALVWQRDYEKLMLNIGIIRDHLNFRKIIDLVRMENHPKMPIEIRKSIFAYLSSLPGFDETKGYDQSSTTLEQHGYLEMQFTRVLSSLADVYGYIFNTPAGEVDMSDVVLNRRILVIMLPALEKSRTEVENIGKIIVSTLKGMMGATLGNRIEGRWTNVVENRPANSPAPFLCILDEVGHYMVKGMDLMAAQARSLGFSMVYAGQDISSMTSLDRQVFNSVAANTNTKLILRTEDPETAELALKGAGEAFRAQVADAGMDSQVKYAPTKRIEFLDLKSQEPGEMHIIHKDKVIRGKAFYADLEAYVKRTDLNLRFNRFIRIPDKIPNKNDSRTAVRKETGTGSSCKTLFAELNDPEKNALDRDKIIENIQKLQEGGDLWPVEGDFNLDLSD